MSGKKFNFLAIISIVGIGIIVYANSFANPFIWDDANLIVSNPYIKDIHLIKNLFTKDLAFGTQFSNFYRPLQSLTFELDYYLWGLNPFGFHLTNLLLHIACALLIYFLFCLIFPSLKHIPLITALLFLVHPIQTEAVTYISGRADSLVSLLMFLAIFFYIKHNLKAQPRFSLYLYMSCVCFILALLSKETALILLLLILLYDISFSHRGLRWRDKFRFNYWPILLVATIYIFLRMTVLNFLQRPLFLSNISLYLRLLTQAKIFALYLILLILPLHLHMERSLPIVSSIIDKDVWCALFLLLLLAIMMVRSYKLSKGCFFASMWFFLCLLPVANIVPLNANMAEHWLYLPSLGFFLIIALGWNRLFQKTKANKIWSIILLIILLTFYSFLTIRRNDDWKDPQRFFQQILTYNPQSAEAHNCLGAIYQDAGRLDLAIIEFQEAVKLDPQNYKSYGNLGSALRRKGEHDLAISVYKKALALRPDIPGLYNNLGNVYADRGEWTKAKEIFSQALQLYPEFALCRANLGKVYYEMGNFDLAIQECKQAIALEPNLVLAHYNLGVVYQRLKSYDLAIEAYQKVISLAPNHILAHLNLGTAYNVQGRLDEAIQQYQKILELSPSSSFAYHNLGVVYFKKKEYVKAKEYFLQALRLNPKGEIMSKDFLKKIEELGY